MAGLCMAILVAFIAFLAFRRLLRWWAFAPLGWAGVVRAAWCRVRDPIPPDLHLLCIQRC